MKLLLTLALLLPVFAPAFANEEKMAMMENMSKDDREKMAKLHENMASCLRSDKEVKACHEQMMTGCKDTMGEKFCAMMKHDKMHGKAKMGK